MDGSDFQTFGPVDWCSYYGITPDRRGKLRMEPSPCHSCDAKKTCSRSARPGSSSSCDKFISWVRRSWPGKRTDREVDHDTQ